MIVGRAKGGYLKNYSMVSKFCVRLLRGWERYLKVTCAQTNSSDVNGGAKQSVKRAKTQSKDPIGVSVYFIIANRRKLVFIESTMFAW